MVYYESIVPTEHYIENHQKEVSWEKVLDIISKTKNPRKNGDKYEIDEDGYYILFKIEDGILYVINAKRSK